MITDNSIDMELAQAEMVKEQNTKRFNNKARKDKKDDAKRFKNPTSSVRQKITYNGILIKGCTIEDLGLDEE